MSAGLGLDPLLTALREAGLPVGVAEVARLREVFALEPWLAGEEDDRRLKAVLRAVLVKSGEDRARFEPIADAWLNRARKELKHREESPSPPPPPPPPPPAPRSARSGLRQPLVLAVAAVAALALLIPRLWPPEKLPEKPATAQTTPAPETTPPLAPEPSSLTPDQIRKRTFTTWVPSLIVTPAPWQGWSGVILGCLALLASSALWLTQQNQNDLPEAAPEPEKKGPPRTFLAPPQAAGPQLLEPREQEALVWGIGHFVADEPTRQLALPATVKATARAGGLPSLIFHQARHAREVWLWIDEAVDDPALPRLAEEIEAVLQSHGLPVEKALFRGVPDWLVHGDGQAFAPNEVNERRDTALVAILTDGRVLARQYAADDRRVRLDALLRGLSHWPRLAFVDFGAPPGELAGVLAKHSLLRVAPPQLAGFLGNDEAAGRRRPKASVAGDATWAAACAVAPASIDELRAFQLRRRLGLATSPWAIRALRTEAPGPPDRLQWKPQDRVHRVNWLRAAEAPSEDGGLAAGSLLAKALDFWEEAYDRELAAQRPGTVEEAWEETPAYQHLLMERALLALWRNPAEAIPQLYRLHGGALREVVERYLGEFTSRSRVDVERIQLPWRSEDRPGIERFMLQQMRFEGDLPPTTLRKPGRLWLGLAACLGLAAGALGAAAWNGRRPSVGQPSVVHGPNRPEDAMVSVEPPSVRDWEVLVATRKTLVEERAVPAGAEVVVRWQRRDLPCVSGLPGGEQWSCGRVEHPSPFDGPILRRVFILQAQPRIPEAENLAIDLLDSGSADLVFLSPQRVPPVSTAIGYSLEKRKAVVLLPEADWPSLRNALWFDGIRPASEVWPGLRLSGDPSTPVRGLASCRNGEILEENGMTFAHICPGTFLIGSTNADQAAYDDEKPAHRVTLNEFWIGRTEVTNAQYGKLGQASLPVNQVNWLEAKTFCEGHGWRLPTEAEWEYATRAGTETPWSFGGDERRLGEYAWYGGNSSFASHPVATKKPNPWGLYDVHGNVWEWVNDWYAPYKDGAQTDPEGPASGTERVVRGGSFDDSPRYLRSAFRFRFLPSGRIRFVGFRCARSRSPRRQP